MQRCHQRDLSGHVVEQGGWEYLRLPAEYEVGSRVTSTGWTDPRTEVGELLWPERSGRTEIESLKRSLGSYGAAGQLQQPRRRRWHREGALVAVLAAPRRLSSARPGQTARRLNGASGCGRTTWDFNQQVQSWDMAFKDLHTSDFVVGQVWVGFGADRFLIDQVRDRLNFPETLDAVRELTRKWPNVRDNRIA